MSEPTLCCRARGGYCERCDLLVGLPRLHVVAVERDDGDKQGGLTVIASQAFHVSDVPGQQVFVYTAPPGSPSADGLALLRRLTATVHDTTSPDVLGERRT